MHYRHVLFRKRPLFGCVFFQGFCWHATSVKSSTPLNAVHICIKIVTFMNRPIQIHANLLKMNFRQISHTPDIIHLQYCCHKFKRKQYLLFRKPISIRIVTSGLRCTCLRCTRSREYRLTRFNKYDRGYSISILVVLKTN